MAYQHFYSRVPARMGMFKRTDGYDTFATSQGVTREYIDKELSAVCDYKPTKNESMLILEDKLPPVYCKYSSKDGEDMILSCLSYIARDYTNERSSFMVHSLILKGEEKQKAISRIGYKILNPNMFVTDLSQFSITSVKSKPIEDYPELQYQSEKTGALKVLTEKYTPKVLERFIFALLMTACGKCKPIYVTVGRDATDLSDNALELMNLILQIFPFNVRDNISFITYQSDYTKFADFKVRFLPSESLNAIPQGKGYLFDNMSTRLADGIRDEDYIANKTVVEFFFGLIADSSMRTAFLKFCDSAMEKDPALAVPTLKTVSALVFLFRQTSGLFTEREVLPDDNKVYDLFCVFEKYRNALSPSERSAVMSSLSRYPRLHTAIPQNIFTKFCKLYPTEPPRAQNTAMETILELFHTDLMRDKLFAFIRSNYASESPKNRVTICKDLCSVFYGGFLQSQILGLFSQYFPSEAEESRDAIVEKLLLVIRTASIRDKTLEFFKNYYSQFTAKQKHRFLATIYEMLVYGDQLADRLLQLLDELMVEEREELRAEVAVKINEALASNQRKKESNLLGLILAREGFCKSSVVKHLVADQSNRKVFEDYLAIFATQGYTAIANELVAIFKAVPYPERQVENRLFDKMTASLDELASKCSLSDAIKAQKVLDEQFVGKFNQQADDFGNKVSKHIIAPHIANRIFDVFNLKLFKDGIAFIDEYAETHGEIKDFDNYKVVDAFKNILSAVGEGKMDKVLENYLILPQTKAVRNNIALCLKKKLAEHDVEYVDNTDTLNTFALALILIEALAKGIPYLSDAYSALLPVVTAVYSRKEEYAGKKEKNLQPDCAEVAYCAILRACACLAGDERLEELKTALLAEEDQFGLTALYNSANTSIGGKIKRTLKTLSAEFATSCPEFEKCYKGKQQKQSKGFLFFKR